MRHPGLIALCLLGAGSLAACRQPGLSPDQAAKAVAEAQATDQSVTEQVMLAAKDPTEAVTFFKNAVAVSPDRVSLKRALAKSEARAGLYPEAEAILTAIIASKDVTNDDRLALADVHIRSGNWSDAATTLNAIPPTVETFERYRLEALVADSKKNWKKADSFYSIAVGMTATPQNVLNNWGYSKLSRGDGPGAERLFIQALSYDPTMFTAKNNLVLARAAQHKYDLPVVAMTQEERAQLIYTAALAAVKQGDTITGKRLLQEAIDTSPTFFEQAVRSLAALGG